MFFFFKDIAGVIKLRRVRSGEYSELSRWHLNAIICILMRGEQREMCTQKKRRRQCNHRDRDWKDVITRKPKIPAATRSYKGLGTASLLEPLKRGWCSHHLDFLPVSDTDFRLVAYTSGREYIAAVLSHRVCGNLLYQP